MREVDAGDKVVTSQNRRDLLTVGESGDYQPKSDAASGQQIVGKYGIYLWEDLTPKVFPLFVSAPSSRRIRDSNSCPQDLELGSLSK